MLLSTHLLCKWVSPSKKYNWVRSMPRGQGNFFSFHWGRFHGHYCPSFSPAQNSFIHSPIIHSSLPPFPSILGSLSLFSRGAYAVLHYHSTQLSFPRLGKSQRLAHLECNGLASPWESHPGNHGLSPARLVSSGLSLRPSLPLVKEKVNLCWNEA